MIANPMVFGQKSSTVSQWRIDYSFSEDHAMVKKYTLPFSGGRVHESSQIV